MPELVLISIRGVFAFVVLLSLARLMGKKQISQLTFFDYVVGITIGSIASSLSIDQNLKIVNGFIGLVIWGGFPILLGLIALKSYTFRKLVDGRPTALIENGNILESNLKKMKMDATELMLLLREKNAFHLSDVEFAVLETNGQLSVMKKSDSQPVTPKDLGLLVEKKHEPRIVVIDGHLLEKSLNDYGYTKEWMLGEIIKQGGTDFRDVFLAQVDSSGNVYVDLYHDKLKMPQIKQKPLVAATMKKLQADLEKFALQTENKEAKEMYTQHADTLKKLWNELNPYLKQ